MTPARQRALLDSLEVRFARAWQKEIARTIRDAAKDYTNSDNYLLAMAKHKENATNLMRRMYQIAGNEFAQPIYEKARGHGMVTKDFEAFARIMQQFINTVGADKVSRITETTNSQIRQIINQGISEGLPVSVIASNLRKIAPTIGGLRSTVIARTELHSASQWAQIEAIRDTGIRLNKEWVSASDERTRIDHMDANGQIVGPDDAFEVGGEKMLYPGDPSGSPENVINCRCVLNFVEPTQNDETSIDQPATIGGEPKFDYENYQGVRSVAEAETYLKEKGIAENVSLKGISPSGMSEAIGAAHEVKERFGLDALKYMGPITRDKRFPYKRPKGANAAVYPSTDALHLPTKFGDLKDAERQIKNKALYSVKYEQERARALAGARFVSDEVKDLVGRMPSGQYTWSITATTASAERAKTMYHEYGHVLHLIDRKIGPQIDHIMELFKPRKDGWDLLLSKYALSNDKEYVAEAFALYMTRPKSEHYRIHPALLKIFRDADKKP